MSRYFVPRGRSAVAAAASRRDFQAAPRTVWIPHRCSKKRPNNKTSNYLISMGENDLKRSSRNYIGKLRANFAGTEFQIFDAGWNPTAFGDAEEEGAAVRAELGAVIYTSNVLGSRGPRKMQARRRVPLMVFSRRHLFRTRPRSVLGSDRGDVAASGSSPPRPSEDGAGPSRPSDGSRPAPSRPSDTGCRRDPSPRRRSRFPSSTPTASRAAATSSPK